MKLNTKVIQFVVSVRIKYDDKNSLKEAIKDIRENLNYEASCDGTSNYHAKLLKPRLEKRSRKTLKELDQPNQLELSKGVVETCQNLL